jgi:hypothetical protein
MRYKIKITHIEKKNKKKNTKTNSQKKFKKNLKKLKSTRINIKKL